LILIALGSWPLLLCLSLLAALPRRSPDSETFASGFFISAQRNGIPTSRALFFVTASPRFNATDARTAEAPDATSTFSRSTSLSDHGVFFVGMALAQVSDTQFANLNSQPMLTFVL
jgi:hypothetical protein